MKICFDNVNWQSASGPNSFAQRLARELSLKGHIIADRDDYDIGLVFIEESGRLDPSKPKVQRLDGIWFHPEEFKTKNVQIKKCYDSADSVVWQSEFDFKMTRQHWGMPYDGTVIRNGIKVQKVDVTNATLIELRERYKKIFVCSANWHRQKRLSENIALFKHLRATVEPYSCLVVMGDNPDCVVSDRNVYYTGALPHETCLEVFSVADWCLHLAWADHSPNVVVEALSQDCPVICSETGGTQELVGANGVVLKETHNYQYELFDYENPPVIDVTQLSSLPDIQVDASAIEISTVAQKYVDVFDRVLKNRI